MKDFQFGLKVLNSIGGGEPDFDVFRMVAGNQYNPYGQRYIDDPSYMVAAGGDKVTSIPSPYARMHVTDIAFREYSSGKAQMSETQLKQKSLPADFVKAMSHCLDLFEITYRMTDLDLKDHGITVTKHDFVTTQTPGFDNLCQSYSNLKNYIETLELFRTRYNDVIQARIPAGKSYYYDFTSNYLFKYNGVTFGSTSPFSGFYTKADCNLVNEKGEAVLVYNGHKFLTNSATDWMLFNDREQQFLDFLYLLLTDTGLSAIYKHLYKALENHVNKNNLIGKTFESEYPNFNLGPAVGQLPQVRTTRGNTYIRPYDIDRCYLKYILFLQQPFDFKVDEKEFKKNIDDRLSPDGSQNMAWLSINDLLSDSLVVLPYDIDETYEAISYLDLTTQKHFRRCLIPIKQEAINYVELKNLIKGLKIKKYDNDHYSVVLTLDLTTGGKIELRRDYYVSQKGDKGRCSYPNGVVIQGAEMKQFVFGIYPFARSTKFENIYKVLFYNDFTSDWDLQFFYETGNSVNEYPEALVKVNKTNTITQDDTYYPHNCTYYEVSGGKIVDQNKHKIGIAFAQLSKSVTIYDQVDNEKKIQGTSLILPSLRPITGTDTNSTTVAIDLGTSNTYMAYYHNLGTDTSETNIQDFSTIHGNGQTRFVELEFMHKDINIEKITGLESYYQDAILPTRDGVNVEALSAQLCEFIPSRIVSQDNAVGFRFPIPSVVNRLRSVNNNNGEIPLLNRSIPFAYYSIGWRKNEESGENIDTIAEGTFKWFYGKDKDGIYKTNQQKKNDFIAFMSELLFIVRSNMLCSGYDLSKCEIIWTYPLSFQESLVKSYTKEWELNFCKYFHPDWIAPNGGILQANLGNVKQLIKSTNESLTPFFACCQDPGAVHHLNLVIDMGGGSTDVIGYRHNKAEFITSFSFAGNSLYLAGNLNHSNVDKKNNYIAHYVNIASESLKENKSVLDKTRKIDINTPISSLMNYGFSQNPDDFQNIFLNDDPKFMLQLHNAALFYHIAQVCHAFVPDEMPVNVYLTGNGSKLICLNRKYKELLRKAFQTAYAENEEVANKRIDVNEYENPKAATVYGALKGNMDGTLSFDTNALMNRVVAFGDDKTFKKIDVDGGSGIPTAGLMGQEDEVYKNVKQFIDMFYDTYGNAIPIINKEEMIECLDFIKGDSKNKVAEGFLSDSLFFQYISLLMEQVSIKLLKRELLKR